MAFSTSGDGGARRGRTGRGAGSARADFEGAEEEEAVEGGDEEDEAAGDR